MKNLFIFISCGNEHGMLSASEDSGAVWILFLISPAWALGNLPVVPKQVKGGMASALRIGYRGELEVGQCTLIKRLTSLLTAPPLKLRGWPPIGV